MKLIYCLSRPISSRDEERFETLETAKRLGAEIEYWLFPSINDLNFTNSPTKLELIKSKSELRTAFIGLPAVFEILFIFPFTSKTVWIHKEFSRSKIPYNYLKLYSNEVPYLTVVKSLLYRLRFIHLRGCKRLLTCRNYTKLSASPFFLISLKSKIEIIASADFIQFRNSETVDKESLASRTSYLVFLDSFLEGHPDYKIPLVEDSYRYWHLMHSILSGYSQKYNLRIVIKEHPRRTVPIPIESFESSKESTAILIANSSLVLCHATTAVNFVALAKIPLIQISLDNLGNSRWYANWIKQINKVLKSKIIGITDKDFDFDIPKIDHNQYAYYVNKHLLNSHHSVQNYAKYLIK